MAELPDPLRSHEANARMCIKCGSAFAGRYCRVCSSKYVVEWRIRNAERRKAVDAEWVRNNRPKVRAAKRRYAENHPEKNKESKAKWQSSNSERMRVYKQNRRGRKLHSVGKLSVGLFDKLFKLQRGKCACCHADLSKKKPHLDHIVPLALLGANSDENIQLLCSSCNQSKNAKHPIDFMQSRGFLL